MEGMNEGSRARRTVRSGLLALAALALAAAMTGCAAGSAEDDAIPHSDTPQSEAAALTSPTGEPGDGTDVNVYEPKLAPKMPSLPTSDELELTPFRDGDMPFGACIVNCCTVTMQRIWDPARQAPIYVPVTTCQ